MAHATFSPHARQVGQLRPRLAHAPALPFTELLPQGLAEQVIRDQAISFRDRLFTPLVTLWVFLSQVLDPDHSCRQAVARFLAWRTAQGLAPCSTDTGAYCKARCRLPETVLARLTRIIGRQAQERAPTPWRWNNYTLKIVDGATVSMPEPVWGPPVVAKVRAIRARNRFPHPDKTSGDTLVPMIPSASPCPIAIVARSHSRHCNASSFSSICSCAKSLQSLQALRFVAGCGGVPCNEIIVREEKLAELALGSISAWASTGRRLHLMQSKHPSRRRACSACTTVGHNCATD